MKRRLVILGSGVCGLAIAIRALEINPDLDVVLIESEERVGGLARSLTLRGQIADFGPHRIHTELPDVQNFLEKIAGDEMARVERRSQMWLRGQWIEYPPQPAEILRVLGPRQVMRAGFSFLAEKSASLSRKKPQEENFESVMKSAFGAELYRLIVLNYTRKVWKIDPRELHADIARVRVSAGGLDRMVKRLLLPEKEGTETALKKFYYIPGGVERLVDRMKQIAESKGARILTNQHVVGIDPIDAGEWKISSENNSGESRTDTADFVFSTIPVTDLVDQLQRHREDPDAWQSRREMKFLANFLVLVVVNKPRVTPNHWLYFPGKDTIFNRGYEPKNFSEAMGPPDETLLMLEITCHHGDAIWNASDWSLIEKTLLGLEKTGLVTGEEVIDTQLHRIPNTYPLYDLQYRERLKHIWRFLSGFENLISVGRQGLFLHNNMDHSIHMGFRAAEVALKEHPQDAPRHFYKEVRRFQKFRIVD